jgi:flagellar hook-basal body complex protein FliE
MELTKPQSVLQGLAQAVSGANGGAVTAASGPSFGDVLKGMLDQTVDAQKQAETLTLGAASGDPVALHDVVQAVSKAELTLQTLVTVRDKAVEAYQQIMQMPV